MNDAIVHLNLHEKYALAGTGRTSYLVKSQRWAKGYEVEEQAFKPLIDRNHVAQRQLLSGLSGHIPQAILAYGRAVAVIRLLSVLCPTGGKLVAKA
jgi:hypothetical protein